MKISDSGHWYTRDGNPSYTVLSANGIERKATLADARKITLVPSVTNTLGIVAKPNLTNWLQDQVFIACQTVKRADESDEEYKAKVLAEASRYSNERRDEGTAIHSAIDRGFLQGEENKYYLGAKGLLDKLFPNQLWFPEVPFASHLGYGGKCDCSSDRISIEGEYTPTLPIIVDWKSKEFTDEDYDEDKLTKKAVSRFIYDDHGMQLSAYGYGLFECINPIRVNIFVRPSDGKCIYYKHEENNDLEKFKAVLKLWQLIKNYDPSWSI